MERVAILGAGHGGQTMAADLCLRGFEVCLYEMPRFAPNIARVLETKTIRLEGDIPDSGVARIHEVTTDIDRAIEDCSYIFIPVPAYAHRDYARLLAPRVRAHQRIVLFPGTLGTLEMKKIFVEEGNDEGVVFAECDTLPYATRVIAEGVVRVFKKLDRMGIAVFPAHHTKKVAQELKPFFHFDAYRDVLESGLSSLNPVLHIGAVVLNLGRIEYVAKTPFYLYEQGYTRSTSRVCEAVDAERLALGRALGFDLLSVSEALYRDGLGPKGSLLQTIKGSEGLTAIEGPNSSDTRYLKEDTPQGFVAWSGLGKQIGVPTPTIDSLTHIVSTIYGEDYFRDGRTLERLGLSGMTASDMLEYAWTGARP